MDAAKEELIILWHIRQNANQLELSKIYFFNPFSVEILQKVIAQILDSYYENIRTIQLFFYYPSDEYISYLMTVDELMYYDEIDCRDLFDGNDSRERIMIFEIM